MRGKTLAWEVDFTDIRGQLRGALKIVQDGAVVFEDDDTPIGFDNLKPSYPSLGTHCAEFAKTTDKLDVLFSGFDLTIG